MSSNYNFSVKHITVATDKDYITALRIYANTTPPVIMTNTNELSSWLSFNLENSFIPMQFALKLNNIVVGYALVSYIKITKIALIDYLALDSNYRLNTVFLAFVNLLQSYIKERRSCVYFIVEISNKGDGNEIDRESRLFKKLLCLEGFCKVNYKYTTPPFGLNAPETSVDAYLCVQANDVLHTLLRDTFFQFVESIYHYYLQWFSRFLSDDEKIEYEHSLMEWRTKIVNINPEDECKVMPMECPLLHETSESTYGEILPQQAPKKRLWLILSLIFLSLPIPVIILYNNILNRLGIPIKDVSTLIGALISAGIAAIIGLTIQFASKKKL